MSTDTPLDKRPDLSAAPPEVVAYIEALEAEIQSLHEKVSAPNGSAARATQGDAALEPSEPPTTIHIISISQNGVGKRTPRHHYIRQRRGGMGVFDLDAAADDPPAFLVAADEADGVIVVTNQARTFRIPVRNIPETPVRDSGEPLLDGFPLRDDERPALFFADRGGSHLALVSERGQVRRIAAHYFGPNLDPGTVLYDPREGGPPAAACWTPGDGDLFLATRQGRAIRFAERQVPVRGCLGMRVDREDVIVGAAATNEEGGVFLLMNEGKGTVRLMSGFGANKSPGASGKVGMKTDHLVGAAGVQPGDDIFVISKLGKIIRFQVDEVPFKEGVVQGVACMNLRADECMAMTTSTVVG